MTDRQTPETDAMIETDAHRIEEYSAPLTAYRRMCELAKTLEREHDEAREAAEKAKAYKRVLKDDNAKLRRELDKSKNDADAFVEKWGKSQERAINAERELDELNKRLIEVCQYGVVCTIEREDLRKELDEARDDTRVLLKEIFNLTQIGDPHPADLPMKALQAIAEMIDEHLKEARK